MINKVAGKRCLTAPNKWNSKKQDMAMYNKAKSNHKLLVLVGFHTISPRKSINNVNKPSAKYASFDQKGININTGKGANRN